MQTYDGVAFHLVIVLLDHFACIRLELHFHCGNTT